MTTVRLPSELERKLNDWAQAEGTTKSELIKRALELWFEQAAGERDSFELGRDYFGTHGSGDGRLSAQAKSKLKEKLRAHRHPR